MLQLWYNSEEVAGFHPPVEQALTNALVKCGYDNIAEIVHHPKIPNSTIIPDFAIRLKANQQYIFICEVKRTERDVESQRYQNQTRSYVTDYGMHWASGYHKYYCITNIERLILFADRSGPLTTCVLKGNPRQHTKFNPVNRDASAAVDDLQATFEQIFPLIFNRTNPDWDNNWEPIIDSFHKNYLALKNTLRYPDTVSTELSLYELFRLLAYAYLKEYYTVKRDPNGKFFRGYPAGNVTLDQFVNSLRNNYDKIIQLDFRQIFSNHPNQGQRLFPENLSANYLQYFRDLIQCLTQYSPAAVADNSSPSYVFNLLTSKIYEKLELHSKGKVMSDAELSNLLATLCIDTDDVKVLDPGCGDGALLDAAYDQISLLATTGNHVKTHNQILSQVEGIEIDPFLSQLAAFRLLSKNLIQTNNTTQANVLIGDMFQHPGAGQYDAVLMNPPFLRNDNHVAPITTADKTRMLTAINATGVNNFVLDAKQPNLYYYFTNYSWHYLKNNGKAGLILMTKFLNNEDGEHLKAFILDKVEAIITYPRKYFQEFVVTTAIVILKKGNNSANVSFLRITDENILSSPEMVKGILELGQDTVTGAYKLRSVPRSSLVPAENWTNYLNEEKYDRLLSLPFLNPIKHHFADVSRGGAESAGGSKIIFPELDVNTNQYFGWGAPLSAAQKKADTARSRINFSSLLNVRIGAGIQNNFTRRAYFLTIQDLNLEKALHFPSLTDKNQANGLPVNFQSDFGLIQLYDDGTNEFGLDKWRRIVNNAFNSTFVAKILIPRADRTKHVVYYNPYNQAITLSTNFFYCNDLRNHHQTVNQELQYQFVSAFLLSAFGQVQFELNANNQEGLRKLEGFQIERFKIPDLSIISQAEFSAVATEFRNISIANAAFSGEEGLNTPRRNLDLAIGTVLFSRNNLGFASPADMVDYFELFLADLVEDRRI
ncbi:BpuSI family type II restriction endonuclease [Chitinophaga sancti]|uniref:BpuSI family type II restriction endonuclease n=1 Tax=Chitinophaga sancti TaxID=1004 RepID=A0A1K1Q4Q1_9BACT|nr:BpuSI family type II restriction endonuclease [Chitinophaga sancti]WQD61124.1 BpuSI family type II restriction endonuclease [Chitinophaga sancti]WQG86749.1 BpuSI family type II restriction endonuclease [Chitinophaga sancti]SFW54887.1 N-6 DNA Methylase [Chitinophaga sancti]